MTQLRGDPARAGRHRFAIVASRFNRVVTDRLLAGARACLEQHDVEPTSVDEVSVPGAWELPAAAQMLARKGRYAAVIAIGCVIRGETPHFDAIVRGVTDGLLRVSLDEAVPVAFGVLTTEDEEQALARAGGAHGNKGWDAALAALELADLRQRLDDLAGSAS